MNSWRVRIIFAAFAGASLLACGALELSLRWFTIDARPYLAADASPVLLDRNALLLHASLNDDDAWSFPKDLDQHARYLIDATVAAEDQRYWSHSGVDPAAIVRASLQNAAERSIASGASTISMQVVKLHAARPRSFGGKARQAWDALRLERAATKSEILAAYLNRAPYGYNLLGAEAASRRYFGKPSSELTLSEAALLAGLPKAPSALDPLRHESEARARRNYVLHRMHGEGMISAAEMRAAIEAPLGASWHDLPRKIPHVRDRFDVDKCAQTTLDWHVQHRTQTLLRQFIKPFDNQITNAAAVVVDVNSAAVLAYCGSADFLNSDGGQMNLARAQRSPGSALKPFVYAVAMQKNRLYPSEMLLDDTLDFGDYSPANYDGEFTGLVSAEEALRYSLNVPAVQVLDRIGVAAAHRCLVDLGLTTLDRSPAHYGLGLVLGNCGVNLDELAAAYRALAAGGHYSPLRFLPTDPRETHQVFSEDIAAATLDMLRQPLPRELPGELVSTRTHSTPVAWKTGTSTGHHDAWAFVLNSHYVVGVWMGNPDGRPSDRLVGAEAALPAAAAIFRSLPVKQSAAWPAISASQRTALVCSSSGLPARKACPYTRRASFPGSMYLNRRCEVHRMAAAEDRVLQQWPSGALDWNLAAIHNPIPLNAADGAVEAVLNITNPADSAEFVLTGKAGGDYLRLRSSLDQDQAVHWYMDGRYLGMSYTETPVFLTLEPGEHVIACMVETGATDSVQISVHAPGK